MTNEIQLRITTDMTTLPAAIEFNYAELKNALQTYLSRFDGLVVTEDEIRRATVERAEINRVAKTIARARIDTKKRYLEPFELFEARAKELEGLCKTVEGKIAEQLDAFERNRIAKKARRLDELWGRKLNEAFGSLESPHFAAFFADKTNPRRTGCWLNKGVSEDSAVAEMDAEINRCREVLDTVEGMYAEADLEIKTKAKLAAERTMDFQRAVQEVNSYRAEREAMARARQAAEERAKAAAEARARAEAAAKAEAEARAKAAAEAEARRSAEFPAASVPESSPETSEVPAASFDTPPSPPSLRTVVLRFTGTVEQLNSLGAAIDAIGIQCESIKL